MENVILILVIIALFVAIRLIAGRIGEDRTVKQRKNESAEAYEARMQQLKKERTENEEFRSNHPFSGWTLVGSFIIILGVFVSLWGVALFYQAGNSDEAIQAIAGLSYFPSFLIMGILLVLTGGVFCGVGEIVKLNKRQAFYVERRLNEEKDRRLTRKDSAAADQSAVQ